MVKGSSGKYGTSPRGEKALVLTFLASLDSELAEDGGQVLVGLVALHETLGTWLLMTAVCVVLPLAWGERRWLPLGIYVAVFPLLVSLLFGVVLDVVLEPGIFDLNAMGKFSTPGLSVFLSLPGPAKPLLAYELMVETAERLAERLGGEVFDDKHLQLSEESIKLNKALIQSYQN